MSFPLAVIFRSFEFALVAVRTKGVEAFRTIEMEDGSRAWRRNIFRVEEGLFERWPSGRVCPYEPSREDMDAMDWAISIPVEQPERTE